MVVPALRVRRAKPVNDRMVNTQSGQQFDSARLHLNNKGQALKPPFFIRLILVPSTLEGLVLLHIANFLALKGFLSLDEYFEINRFERKEIYR